MKCLFMSFAVVLGLWLVSQLAVGQLLPVPLPPTVISAETDEVGLCGPSDRVAALNSNVKATLESPTLAPFLATCGPGNWRRVFYLNATDTTQMCPGQWQLTTTHKSDRACTNPGSACVSAFSQSPLAYSKVCGRVTGDGQVSPDAFNSFSTLRQPSLESNYVDGVSITYGVSGSRIHIWTLGASGGSTCPCADTSLSPPSEVGEDYFCEGISSTSYLWDGVECPNSDPCWSFNNPPYFKVNLRVPTTEAIELRICQDQQLDDESVYVLFADIYVQ